MKLWPFNKFKLWPFFGYPAMPPQPEQDAPASSPNYDPEAQAPQPQEPPKQLSFGELVLADLLKYPVEEWQFEYSRVQGSTYQTVSNPKVPYRLLFTNFSDNERAYVSVMELEGDPFSDSERFELFRTLKRIKQAQWDAEDARKKADDVAKIKKWYPNAKV